MKINGFITNLGKYNEGYLIGKWITFPIGEEELEKVLEEIGIDGKYYEEYFFTDFDNNIFDFGEFTSIDTINDVAERLEYLQEDEDVIKAIIDNCCDMEESLNILENESYTVYGDCNSMTDVAYYCVEEFGMLENAPQNLVEFFDYDAYGRHLDTTCTFIGYDNGYIELHK